MKRTIICMVVLTSLILAGGTAFAQDVRLAVSTGTVVVDGVVAPNEYSVTRDLGKVALSFRRSADTLWIAAVGATTGWVAVGLDSLKMDKAAIFMGFVEQGGGVQFKPQVGVGRSHRDTAEKEVLDSIISSALKEQGEKTTLEIALKASSWIAAGQTSLETIFAIGGRDSFTTPHSFRGSLPVALVQ